MNQHFSAVFCVRCLHLLIAVFAKCAATGNHRSPALSDFFTHKLIPELQSSVIFANGTARPQEESFHENKELDQSGPFSRPVTSTSTPQLPDLFTKPMSLWDSLLVSLSQFEARIPSLPSIELIRKEFFVTLSNTITRVGVELNVKSYGKFWRLDKENDSRSRRSYFQSFIEIRETMQN